MDLGFTVLTNIEDWKLAKEAEDVGFDSVWFPDSQMIWSDCYSTMALAWACISWLGNRKYCDESDGDETYAAKRF